MSLHCCILGAQLGRSCPRRRPVSALRLCAVGARGHHGEIGIGIGISRLETVWATGILLYLRTGLLAFALAGGEGQGEQHMAMAAQAEGAGDNVWERYGY